MMIQTRDQSGDAGSCDGIIHSFTRSVYSWSTSGSQGLGGIISVITGPGTVLTSLVKNITVKRIG